MNDRFLGRARPIGEARLLWEIGAIGEGRIDETTGAARASDADGGAGAEIRVLRERLGLDSGYTSRMLRSLEQQGLIEIESSPDDRRVRRVRLTTTGWPSVLSWTAAPTIWRSVSWSRSARASRRGSWPP